MPYVPNRGDIVHLRKAAKKESVPQHVLNDVMARLEAILFE